METAIQAIWWIGLLGGLALTLVVVRLVLLVLRTLRDIHELAERTREAATALASSLEAIGPLAALPDVGEVLRDRFRDLPAAAHAIEATLSAAAGKRPGGG